MIKMIKEYLRMGVVAMLLMASVTVNAQCQYCYTYENFIEGRWEKLDTVIINSRNKEKKTLVNGEIYRLSTGNKAIDKKLAKNVFAVMKDDTLYINCNNLKYGNQTFDKSIAKNKYVMAKRIGQHSLLFVAGMVDTNEFDRAVAMGVMFGALGGVLASASTGNIQSYKVCYVISSGADAKGHIYIRVIDDSLMDQMLLGHDQLRYEYYLEEDDAKRQGAKNVLSYLKKAGLFNQASLPQKTNE